MTEDHQRLTGAFYTPKGWAREARKYLGRVLPGWKKDCLVYDPAAGRGALVAGPSFSDLILTTLEHEDVPYLRKVQPGALVQQLDYLNDPLPTKVREKLEAAAKAGKRIVFLMNPPYGTSGVAGAKGESKAGIADTAVRESMREGKQGSAAKQLYAQFMYQCVETARKLGFKKITVALFSNPKFMTSGSFRPLRKWWYDQFAFQGGFLFRASHFEGLSDRWGISFTVWSEGTTSTSSELDLDILGEKKPGSKALYATDGKEASKWVREPIKGLKGEDAPQMSSGLKVKEKGRGSLVPGALYFFGNNANNLQDSGTLVYNVSSADTRNNGLSVTPANWRRAIALFAARKLVKGTWINDKDEYLVPDEEADGYEQWVDDCHVYALLHPSNNCTAMREVEYKGKTWRISNHFFWITQEEALGAFRVAGTRALFQDCQDHPAKDVFGNDVESTPDPYMASIIDGLNLSPVARDILAKLDDLWLRSLPRREEYARAHPDLHLLAWDAGYYQLKNLWREEFPKREEELQAAYRKLGEKLQPGVYDYGFLKG